MSFETDFQEPKDRYFASEDLDFQSGDSPVVLDVESSLGVKSIAGLRVSLIQLTKEIY